MFSSGSIPLGPKVETKRALLLIDLQNDFVSSQGKLYVPNTSTFVSKLPSLVAKFREQGQVVWTQTVFEQDRSSISLQTGGYSIVPVALARHLSKIHEGNASEKQGTRTSHTTSRRRRLPILEDDEEAFLSRELPSDQRCCQPGSTGFELAAELLSVVDEQHDLVVKKSSYSALADFGIVVQLRARMIHDLYICGSLSNIGVHATVQDAVQQGFNVTLIEDCLGFRTDACHIEAMRRMADDMGADGIDYQELLDDLYGLLGDVIPASRFTQKFQLSVQPGSAPGQFSNSQMVTQWMRNTRTDNQSAQTSDLWDNGRLKSSFRESSIDLADYAAPHANDSSSMNTQREPQPKYNTSRKRSTSERAETDRQSQPTMATGTPQRGPSSILESGSTHEVAMKKSKTSSTGSSEASSTAESPERLRTMGQSVSTGHLESMRTCVEDVPPTIRAMSQPDHLVGLRDVQAARSPKLPKKKKRVTVFLGPEDIIAEGDTAIIYDILCAGVADQTFSDLKNNIRWQKMYHRTGEVPRLVAVQGFVGVDGSLPIYRHPADESPTLLRFDATVDFLRDRCERYVGHKLNHVLIQYYRSGEDNISEHSDKTLDIVRGSNIVNLSLGAMRIMTIRTKKSTECEPRITQRIKMPHNSLFVLGERTNANWLHSVRADKRPIVEKSEDELAFDSERISLTFRLIGTFIDPQEQLIWGQGASGKTREAATLILQGSEAEASGQDMIIGFGKENHMNGTEFDWHEVYGKGFDIVNFEVKDVDATLEDGEGA